MSRLIDKLNLAASGTARPMGFRAVHTSTSQPRMLLIASVQKPENIGNPADYFTAADAILLHTDKATPEAGFITVAADTLPDIPCGCYRKDAGGKSIEGLMKSGCDFAVFPATGSVPSTGKNDKLGIILQVELSLSDGLLRAINNLPVDAVLAEGVDSFNWYNLMELQRFANMLTKPLLVTVPQKTTADELKTLWEAGADGVVIEVSAIRSTGVLKKLRQDIGKLDFTARKRERADALVPYNIEAKETETEPEEEWEED